jgi:glycosyltransferase involved in cell wall biosynthesis
MPTVSIVVPAFQRPDHLRATLASIFGQWCSEYEVIVVDDGGMREIKEVCDEFPAARYYRLDRESRWKNPGRALNVGLRLAEGKWTIIQHSGIVSCGDTTAQIHALLVDQPSVAILARINEQGVEVCGSQRPYFLLGGMLTQHFLAIRGYDEDFTEYGYEDDDLAVRLSAFGIRFDHRWDIIGEHLPHPRTCTGDDMERMRSLHYRKIEDLRAGRIDVVRNKGREWGSLL